MAPWERFGRLRIVVTAPRRSGPQHLEKPLSVRDRPIDLVCDEVREAPR